MNTNHRSLTGIALSLLAVAAFGVGCYAPEGEDAGVEGVEAETTESSEAELTTAPLVGKVVAYATTNGSNTGARQAFGPGEFRADQGELSGVGNDKTRLFELGPATEVVAFSDEGVNVGRRTGTQNLTGANRTFAIAADFGVSKLEVHGLVVGYRDPNFTGVAEGFGIGRHEIARGQLTTVGNDAISSLRVGPGLQIRICSDDPELTTGGSCSIFTESVAQLPASINDRASWLEVRPLTVVHRDPTLAGAQQTLGAGRFQVGALLTVGNDAVSSVTVHEGVTTRLCSDDPNATVGGTCASFTDSTNQLASNINDRTSFIENRHNVVLNPLDHQSFDPEAVITFRGYATSPDDGTLAGTKLTWSSNVDGVLGTGNVLTKRLSAADYCSGQNHVITLTSTDSKGVVTKTSRIIHLYRVC